MSTAEAFSIAASIVSIALAAFAIWFAVAQRQESQGNYTSTKDVLGEITKVMEKTELLVSQNFQDLLKNMTEQQNKVLESVLAPRPTERERVVDLMIKLASDDPAKLEAVAIALEKIGGTPQPQAQANPMLDFLKMAQELNQSK